MSTTDGRTFTWRIDDDARARFVRLSGDANPLHADPVAARRVPFGRVAVHGMHLVLDALERIVAVGPGAPRRVRCTFRHLIGVDEEIRTVISWAELDVVVVRIFTDVWLAAELTVDLGPPAAPAPIAHVDPPSGTVPEDHDIESLVGHRRTLPSRLDVGLARQAFRTLIARMGVGPLAELVSLTRLVGMHVPGLHSLDSAFDLRFDLARPPGHRLPGDELHVAVTVADERFSRVVLDVRGPTLGGRLTAFVRARPVDQHLDGTRPAAGELAGQRWLVVGGSRGLGALAVLLADAGGAGVRFTYRLGAADAAALAARTDAAQAFALSAGNRSQLDAVLDGWAPTHLAYMATPPSTDGRHGTYSTMLRARLDQVFVDDFLATVDQIGADRLRGVLWPSAEAVAAPPPAMAEYADAKRAGEAALGALGAAHPQLRISAPRWPRLLTDQTTSFVPTEYGDGPAEVLAALRAAAGATAEPYTPTPCPSPTTR